jgi:LacI family transcriptional regulator
MASLKQIAMEAKLAEATVSRILRRQDQCSPETRARVWELAKQYKYRPNLLVRGMQTGRTKTVGVLLPLASEFFGKIFAGIHDELVARDHVPIVLWCHDQLAKPGDQGDECETTELQQIYRLLDRRVDGVILRPVDDAVNDQYLKALWERNLPVVAVNRELEHTHADFIGADDLEIGRRAAEHLLALGHRRLGHIAGPESVTTARLRREGFDAACRAAGAACVTVVDRFYGIEKQPIQGLLSRPDRPTAVFAVNDQVAANVYDVAERLGLRIPHDLSVVGCANMLVSTQLRPKLTTFDEHPHEYGRRAVQMLMHRLDNPNTPPDKVRLRPDLIPRDSTAAWPQQ